MLKITTLNNQRLKLMQADAAWDHHQKYSPNCKRRGRTFPTMEACETCTTWQRAIEIIDS